MKNFLYFLFFFTGVLNAQYPFYGHGKNANVDPNAIVYHVTNRNNDGVGSLRYGLEELGPDVYTVFDVSGYIDISTPIRIRDSGHWVAGQTAPDGGIIVTGASIWIENSNVVLQHFRVFGGYDAWNPASLPPGHEDYEPDDGIRIQAFSSTGIPIENVILDHMTIAFSHDGIFDAGTQGSPLVQYARNFTVQNSMLVYNIDKYYGVLINNAYNFTFYRTMIAFTNDRNIAVSSPSGYGGEMVNCWVYGTQRGSWYREGNVVDYRSNWFEEGNNTRQYETFKMELGVGSFDASDSRVYLNDNYDNGEGADSNYNSRAVPYIVNEPSFNTGLTVISGNTVKDSLNGRVGAIINKEDFEDSVFAHAITGTGNIIDHEDDLGGFPSISSNVRNSSEDSDNDDMLDIAEIALFGSIGFTNNPNGFNPSLSYPNFSHRNNIEKTFMFLGNLPSYHLDIEPTYETNEQLQFILMN